MKKVRFEDPEHLSVVACEVFRRCELTNHDCNSLWFSAQEFDDIKTSCRQLAKQLQGSGREQLLDTSILQKRKRRNEELDLVQQRLIRWSRHCISCRGLERWIHVEEWRKRKRAQKHSVYLVLEMQERQSRSLPDARDEELRLVYEEVTKSARVHALQMGIADAAAVLLEIDSSLKQ